MFHRGEQGRQGRVDKGTCARHEQIRFLMPSVFCFLTSRLFTYAQLQDDCPSIYNANVAQDSKPWADDRAPNAIFACFVS